MEGCALMTVCAENSRLTSETFELTHALGEIYVLRGEKGVGKYMHDVVYTICYIINYASVTWQTGAL